MTSEEIAILVKDLGFPIIVCASLGVYIWWNEKKQTEAQNKRDEIMFEAQEKRDNKMYEEIKYNREVNSELLATNKLLANDIKGELKEIKYVVIGEGGNK